jgi:hypothetical protein
VESASVQMVELNVFHNVGYSLLSRTTEPLRPWQPRRVGRG